MVMRQTFFLCLMVLVAITTPVFIQAQVFPQQKTGVHPGIQKGNSTLQFYLLNDVALSARKYIADGRALQVNIDISGMFSDASEDQEQKLWSPNDTLTYDYQYTTSQNNQGLNISFHYLVTPYRKSAMNMYISFGPSVGYQRSFQKQEDKLEQKLIENTRETTYSRWSFGLSGNTGVQCFLTPSVGVFADYRLSLEYYLSNRSSTSENINTNYVNHDERDNRGHSWNITLSKLRVGILVNL
ncbi:MAG: hypothetical protein Kow0042_12740 [Calditrichia bacterium]